MNGRRFGEARALLEPAVRAFPQSADAHHFLGMALHACGDARGAEREWRSALAIDTKAEGAATELAKLLNAGGRHEEALAVTASPAALPRPAQALLAERARAYQALERVEERLAERQRIVDLYPGKPNAQHNLAAALGDVGHAGQAEAAARQAFALGGDAPETWLVLARALQSQNRLADAEAAFDQALRRRPAYVDALRDRAQLIWMRTGDLTKAAASLEAAGLPETEARRVRIIQARFFDSAGDPAQGYRLLDKDRQPDPELEIVRAHLSLGFDRALALDHAVRADALAPDVEAAQRTLINALLANGRAADALARTEAALVRRPLDQGLIAAQWTAWRALGDPRARALYDYEAFVHAHVIDTPPGWTHLDDYLADLAATLRELHAFQAHPLDQSLRRGTQTSANLLKSDHPVIRAFVKAIDGPIRRHMALIGTGTDRLRSRNTGNYQYIGMWSVRLQPGGFHVNHTHPMGWLSSACYIEVPDGPDVSAAREGWIKFGEPGIPVDPPMEAEFAVQPRPGQLVLFPSYMWHGTIPLTAGPRMTIAFDIAPT